MPFSRTAGMSGNLIVAALYDREGSLWVGTPTGIDRFRETKLTPIAPPGYLELAGVAPDTGGTAWVATRRGPPAALLRVGDRIVPRLDAPPMLTCIYRDLRGGLWIGGIGLWERKGDAFAPVPLPPVQSGGAAFEREIQAVARERDGGLWVAIAFNAGVFRRRPGRGWEQFVARPGLERSPANVITTDTSGRTWLGYQSGELVLVVGDSVRLFAAEQGLDVGRVLAISVYGDRVWIGGQSGVAALDPREADRRGHRSLSRCSRPGSRCAACRAWSRRPMASSGSTAPTASPGFRRRRFAEPSPSPGTRSGTSASITATASSPRRSKSVRCPRPRPARTAASGSPPRGASPGSTRTGCGATRCRRRCSCGRSPPDGSATSRAVGGRHATAPAAHHALGVAYTAYSLAVPDRVRFKYRLEGLDTTWQDAGGETRGVLHQPAARPLPVSRHRVQR